MKHESGSRRKDRARLRLISGRLRARRRKVAAPLKRGVFLVPATITSIGLMAGVYSLICSINGHFELAAVMIAVSVLCDGLDGRVARASRTSSQFGVEYDSLADAIAFGVAPAGLVYMWALKPVAPWAWFFSAVFVLCAALRLARFNVQAATVSKNRFVGLPVPGAAGAIAGTVLAYSYFELNSARTLFVAAAILTVALAGLMISAVPYPSFKTLNLRRRASLETIALIFVGASFVVTMPQVSAFIAATLYVLSGPYLMFRGERTKKPAPALYSVSTERGTRPLA